MGRDNRNCYDFYLVTSRTPALEKGKLITSGWWGTEGTARLWAEGMAAMGWSALGLKSGKIRIYEGEVLRNSVSW